MSEVRWLAELPLHGWQQRIQVIERLFETRSAYQHIEIWDTVPFGRTLVLDGAIQTTQQDEFIYHEMLAHVALCAHPQPRRVLVVGGGDGGCLRRVLQHPVRKAVQVEIDQTVVDACLRWLPDISAGAYDDPRAKLVVQDAMEFLDQDGDPFDLILVDSTDPVGAAAPLFTRRFYEAVQQRLAADGIFVTQSGSPLLMLEELCRVTTSLRSVFRQVGAFLAVIPSYPGGLWSFCVASPSRDVARVSAGAVQRRFERLCLHSRYYTPDLHRASFHLPAYLCAALSGTTTANADPPIRPLSLQPSLN